MEVKQILGGRYELADQIGTGGMAVVWRARDEVLGRSVAIKLLAGPYASDPSARRRIRDEARAAAMLSHPHIAQVYDYGESTAGGECVPYVVMELVPGGTLAQRLATAPMPVRESFRVCAQVAEALAAAHADGLVHRDIKPANVMVTPAGAKVVDFGIAAAISPGGAALGGAGLDGAGLDGAGLQVGELLGTPAYLAPERLTGDAVEPASDVYALGVMLYRMLAGHSPWSADTTTKMLAAHIYIDPTPLPRLPDVPDYVTGLVNRCLSKDPMQRPSAREVAAMLTHAAGSHREPAPSHGPFPADGEPSRVLTAPSGPATSGPSAPGPPAPGAFASGPPASSAFSSGPSATGPSASGPPTSWPPAPGGPASGTAASGTAASGAAGSGTAASGTAASGTAASGPGGGGEPVAVPALRPATPRAGITRRRVTVGAGAVAVGAVAALLWVFLHPGYEAPELSMAPPDDVPGASAVAAASSRAPVDGKAPTASASVAGPGGSGRRPAGQDDAAEPERRGRTEATGGPAAGGADSGGTDRGGSGPGANAGEGGNTQGGGDAAGNGDPDDDGGDDNGGGPEPTPAATPAESLQTRTLSSTGGTVEASCRPGGSAEIISYAPKKTYKMRDLEAGPSSAPRIEFRHGNRVVRMTISCDAGEPSTRNTDL